MTSKTLDKTTTNQNRCDHRKVEIGSVFSRHSHGVVTAIDRGRGLVSLRNSQGKTWDVGLNILEWEFSLADQYDEEEKVSRTKLIEILKESAHTAMTIVFHKKPKTNDNADQILDLINEALKNGKAPTKTVVRKLAASHQAGEERTMIGHHVGSFDEHQRLRFTEQVNAKTGNPEQRLVDLRTVESMVVARKKYVVK